MLKTAPKALAIVGLNATNRVSAFWVLRDDCNVEVYVYVTSLYTLFDTDSEDSQQILALAREGIHLLSEQVAR